MLMRVKCRAEDNAGNIFSLSQRKSVQFFLSCIYIISTAKFAAKVQFFYRKSKYIFLGHNRTRKKRPEKISATLRIFSAYLDVAVTQSCTEKT
jgi:hypothetical protein